MDDYTFDDLLLPSDSPTATSTHFSFDQYLHDPHLNALNHTLHPQTSPRPSTSAGSSSRSPSTDAASEAQLPEFGHLQALEMLNHNYAGDYPSEPFGLNMGMGMHMDMDMDMPGVHHSNRSFDFSLPLSATQTTCADTTTYQGDQDFSALFSLPPPLNGMTTAQNDFSSLFAPLPPPTSSSAVTPTPTAQPLTGPTMADLELLRKAQQQIFDMQQRFSSLPLPLSVPSQDTCNSSITSSANSTHPSPKLSQSGPHASSNPSPSNSATSATPSEPQQQAPARKSFKLKAAFLPAESVGGPSDVKRSLNGQGREVVDLVGRAGLATAGKPAMAMRGFKQDSHNSSKVPIPRLAQAPTPASQPTIAPKTATTVKRAREAMEAEALAAAALRAAEEKRRKNLIGSLDVGGLTGHNAVEKRYRENINSHITHLRTLIPSLALLSSSPTLPLPPPGTLIDGTPLPSKLSKSTILATAVLYIKILQMERKWGEEDLDDLKRVVKGVVEKGNGVVKVWEKGRGERAEARKREREGVLLGLPSQGDEDDEEDEEDIPPVVKRRKHTQSKNLRSSAATSQQPTRSLSAASSTTESPPSSIDPTLLASPTSMPKAPPRAMFAAFMGVGFTAGAGFSWSSTAAAAAAEEEIFEGAAWAVVKGLGKRSVDVGAGGVGGDGLVCGLVGLGIASTICVVLFLLWPVFTTMWASHTRKSSAHRLAALKRVSAATDVVEIHDALGEFVGRPVARGSLIAGSVSEAMRIFLAGGSGRGRGRVELQVAAAWVRLAEIECSEETRFPRLTSLYTFLKLYNLSRSSSWPANHLLTAPARVNALLSVHLIRNSHLLPKAVSRSLWASAKDMSYEKKDDAEMFQDQWTSVAVGMEFEEMENVLAGKGRESEVKTDTMPLLRVAERKYEAALVDTWAKIFVAVIRATAHNNFSSESLADAGSMVNLVKAASLASEVESEVVDAAIHLIDDAVQSILASTLQGTEMHTLALVTAGLWYAAFEEREKAFDMVRSLALEAKEDGPAARLRCARELVRLVAGEESVYLSCFEGEDPEPRSEVEHLACATLDWLVIRRRFAILSAKHTATSAADPDNVKPFRSPELHRSTLRLRRLLAEPVFRAESVVAASVGEQPEARKEKGMDPEFDMVDAVEGCVDALTEVGKRCMGVVAPAGWDDSGCELSD